MPDLTDEAVKALLAHYDLPTDCDCDGDDCVKCSHYPTFQERASKQLKDAAPDIARALIASEAARKLAEERLREAELAFENVDAQVEDEGEFTERSWEQLRADAQAAVVALVVERAATEVSLNAWRHEGEDAYSKGMDAGARHQAQVIYNAIRALAPADGLAAVDALRAEIADLKMNMDADLRTMVREGQQLRTLASEHAALEAKVAGLELIKAAYEELVATVRGECPSLISDDSGGSQVLINLVIEADAARAPDEPTEPGGC